MKPASLINGCNNQTGRETILRELMSTLERYAILIPAYKPTNELIKVVEGLLNIGFSRIVVVDDGSGPQFSDVFDTVAEHAVLLKHSHNLGKGSALKTGLAYIHEQCGDCLGVITCDADGQHTPEDIFKITNRLVQQNNAPALILGSRRFKGNVPLRSAFGNTVTRGVYFLASGVCVGDTQTGLRAFPSSLIPQLLKMTGNRYEYEINMLLEIAKHKIPIIEVTIETVYIDGNKSSHFHAIRDSAIIYGSIIKFSLSSLLCFGIDFAALFLLRYLTGTMSAQTSLLISVIGARSISSLINYWLNRHVVFKKSSRLVIIRYYILVLCILGLNYILLSIFNQSLGIPLFWSKIMTEASLFAISYVVQNKLIFKEA